MFQNRRLTKRLVFAMMEMVLLKVFPGHFDKVFEQTHQHVSKAQGDDQASREPSQDPSGPDRSGAGAGAGSGSGGTPRERSQTGTTGTAGAQGKQRGHTRTGSSGNGGAPARHKRTGSMG